MSGAQQVVFPFLLLMLPSVAVIAWWLKRRYTAAIIRLQKEAVSVGTAQGNNAAIPESEPSAAPQRLPELPLCILAAQEVPYCFDGMDETDRHRRLRRRVLFLQFWSGLLYWCVLWLFAATVFVGAVGDPTQVFAVVRLIGPLPLLALLVPAVIAWLLQAGVDRRLMNIAAVVVLAVALGLQFSKAGWESVAGFSFGYAAIALLVSAFLRPSIRGAGLPLMSAGIVGWIVLTAMFALALALDSDDAETSMTQLAVGVVVLVFILAATVWCGWRTLMRLALKYQAKRFSDMQLALASYWALLTAFMLGSVLRDQTLLVFSSSRLKAEWVCVYIIVLWLLWRSTQSVALRRAVRTAEPSIGPLLFLRVFKPSRRSEEFTDRFFAYWRFAAPVWMIAGPDLTGAYMEPDEFFAYLKGRLRERFIANPDEAASRVEALDNARDPDGRFRVNEVLCSDTSWQPAVLQMMSRAGVILLDLREYSQQRKGTRFELTELLRRASLDRVLLLIDAKDDVSDFTREIESIWREVGGYRNDSADLGDLHILRFSKGSNTEMHGLFRATVHAAAATRRIGKAAG
jgi:hypothetical protein